MEGTRKRPWSDLPSELLSMIGSRLHTRMDVLRFRSVCSLFRSSIPLPAPRFPLPIPRSTETDLLLRESTVYTLDTPTDRAASGRLQWLLKLEESELGDMRILSVLSRRPIVGLPLKFPKVLDSLQLVEICREYTLEYGGHFQAMLRVVVHPVCAWTDLDQRAIYFIDLEWQLWYWKYGDEKWSHLGWGYEDIVVYHGKVCVVDKSGLVFHIDSSFRLQNFSLPIDGCGCHRRHRKRLVVSSGDLYVVDECFTFGGTPDFRAYRLDQQCGRWEKVRSLGNSAFFLCDLCSFSVSAHELDWCKGDCIYYDGRSGSLSSTKKVMLFDLACRKNEYPGISFLKKRN